MTPISAVIITKNEEANIERCLLSLHNIADEIVVVDSFSTDNTVTIAQQYNAYIISNKFIGYGSQKNFGNTQAQHDWVLSIDADEVISDKLKDEINQLKHSNFADIDFASMPRLNNYCGKWIHHSGWYPDRKVRLFNKNKGFWQNEIHEFWQPYNNTAGIQLKSDLLHYTISSPEAYKQQTQKYAQLSATESIKNNKSISILKLTFGSFWVFFKMYFIKLGFLDGKSGFEIAKFTANASKLKYQLIYHAKHQPN